MPTIYAEGESGEVEREERRACRDVRFDERSLYAGDVPCVEELGE